MIRIVEFVSGGASTGRKVYEATLPGGVLHGLVEVVAVASSHPEKNGLINLQEAGFPKEHCYAFTRDRKFMDQQLEVLEKYDPDYYHQLGYMPQTQPRVIRLYPEKGLNQHYGPGGKYMHGVRRAWAHKVFCEEVGMQPIPVFCQEVHVEMDKGNIVYRVNADWSWEETPEDLAKRLLPLEHYVQIEGLRQLALGIQTFLPVPQVARNEDEVALLERIKKEADDYYTARGE